MNFGWLLPVLVMMPIVFGFCSFLLRSAKAALLLCAIGTLCVASVSCVVTFQVFCVGPLFAISNWFMMDVLSAYHVVVMMMVFSLSALYSIIYFTKEIASGIFTDRMARRYAGLWFGSLAAMMLVLVSNNLVIMWVGIEATTLLTAFLICIHRSPEALEAMWKYLFMCSVGVAFAFMGILLIAVSTQQASLNGADALLWTVLRDAAQNLNPSLLKAGFIFLVIGYGTKAGLAPMHNWLPDAHSQSPSPVSAVFSGFLLNTALYCILRCLPLVETATGNVGWGREILIGIGILSILIAAIFILFQHDIKRLLAYSSVEHIGIIVLGVGIGGFGTVAALFHILNHSLAKTLAFSSAGMLGQSYGTHDIRRLCGIVRNVPVWGIALIIGLLIITGVAPFAIFLSEFFILKAIMDQHLYWIAGLFLLGVGIVFISVLKLVIDMAWKPLAEGRILREYRWFHAAFVVVPLSILLLLGLWIPDPFLDVLVRASEILGGTP